MSSSFRSRKLAIAALLAAPAVVQAQQNFFLPSFETAAEWHNNRELATASAQEKSGGIYYARAEALIGRVDQRSNFELRPWISYQEVPNRKDNEPLEIGVNLRSLLQTTKSDWRFNARYMERDAVTSEIGSAGFDSFDPNNTPGGDTGVVTVGGKRKDLTIYPNVTYRFTELTRLEMRLEVDQVSYDNNLAFRRVGYDANAFEATVVHRLSRRVELIAGPYVENFESDDKRNKTDGYGLILGTGFSPAETAFVTAQVRAERNDVTTRTFTPVATETKDKQTSVGFEVVGHYSWPASRVVYNAGRFLEPGTIGSRVKNDTLRVQYSRFITARLTAVGAVRLQRDDRIEDAALAGTNKRFFADLSVYWQLTPTWYVGGGYRFLQQDLAAETHKSSDHAVFVQLGYRALDPRPRRAQ